MPILELRFDHKGKKMKTLKSLSISFLLLTFIASCNLPRSINANEKDPTPMVANNIAFYCR